MKNFKEFIYGRWCSLTIDFAQSFLWSSLDKFRNNSKDNYHISKPNYFTFFLFNTSFLFNNNLLSLYLFHLLCALMSVPITFAINTHKPNKIIPFKHNAYHPKQVHLQLHMNPSPKHKMEPKHKNHV
jgi:hypothetical protein